jgi:hypothetical protein
MTRAAARGSISRRRTGGLWLSLISETKNPDAIGTENAAKEKMILGIDINRMRMGLLLPIGIGP